MTDRINATSATVHGGSKTCALRLTAHIFKACESICNIFLANFKAVFVLLMLFASNLYRKVATPAKKQPRPGFSLIRIMQVCCFHSVAIRLLTSYSTSRVVINMKNLNRFPFETFFEIIGSTMKDDRPCTLR